MQKNKKNIFKFVSINKWLFEQTEQNERFYGCISLEPSKIEGWKENHLSGIEEKDIFEKVNDDSYGLEYNPHMILLYGIIEDKIDPSVIADMADQKMKPIESKIYDIDYFELEDCDVVIYKVPMNNQILQYRNMFKQSFENKQTQPQYNPHITISFVKKGLGKKYKKKLNNPFKIILNKCVYTYHKNDDTHEKIRRVTKLNDKSKMDNTIIKSKPIK